MELSDAELVRATLEGDISSFELILKKYQPRIFAMVRRHSRGEHEIEDVAQEIFIKAFQKLGSYRSEAPFEHWLMRLAVRTCYDHLRRQQRNRETRFADMGEGAEEWLQNLQTSGDAHWNAQDAYELVQHCLAKLPPAGQLVLRLLELEERSVKEIAELTGWSVPVVKVRAFRARAQLRKHLAAFLPERM